MKINFQIIFKVKFLKKNFFEMFWIWPTFFQKNVLRFFFFFTNFFLNLGYIARMFSETMKDSRNLFFAYCLWHIGDGSARKFFFEKTSYDVIMTSSKTSIFSMKCSLKSVKHAFLTGLATFLNEINLHFFKYYNLENEMKLMLKKKIFEIFWIGPTFFQKKFYDFFFFLRFFFKT